MFHVVFMFYRTSTQKCRKEDERNDKVQTLPKESFLSWFYCCIVLLMVCSSHSHTKYIPFFIKCLFRSVLCFCHVCVTVHYWSDFRNNTLDNSPSSTLTYRPSWIKTNNLQGNIATSHAHIFANQIAHALVFFIINNTIHSLNAAASETWM